MERSFCFGRDVKVVELILKVDAREGGRERSASACPGVEGRDDALSKDFGDEDEGPAWNGTASEEPAKG